MKSIMNVKVRMYAIALLVLLIPVISTACGYYKLKHPEEINMAEMHGHEHHAATGQSAGQRPAAAEISCEQLVEPASDAPVKRFELTAQRTELRIGGKTAEAWTFDGSTPGPELRVAQGDRIVVKLTNKDIDRGVTIHWHGVVLPCSQDGVAGVTQDAVGPGETFTYEFIARHAGTYWYHSHQMSSVQSGKGLIGRLIVEPGGVRAADYDRDYAVTLQKLGDKYALTNGSPDGMAFEAKPGERVRLRLINSMSEVQRMGVAGTDFRVMAIDGQDLNEPEPVAGQWIAIGGGQRYDVLFTMPASGRVDVYSRDSKKHRIWLGEGKEPERLSKNAPLFDFTSYGKPIDDGVTADMAFDRSFELRLGILDINGKRGHEVPPITVKEGEWVKIKLSNAIGGEHPMHMHGHLFKVLTKNGKPLSGSPVYADSILVTGKDEYEIAFKADNPGLWMEHCHNLGHAANGMTMMINYEGVTTPYRVGTKSGNLPD